MNCSWKIWTSSFFYFVFHRVCYLIIPYSCIDFSIVLSIINKVHSINLSANIYVFGDFKIHNMNWFTNSSGTVRPGKLLICSPAVIPDGDFFLFSNLVFILQWLCHHWNILIMLLSKFPLALLRTQRGTFILIVKLLIIFALIGMVFLIF